jgi:hypothetical protein
MMDSFGFGAGVDVVATAPQVGRTFAQFGVSAKVQHNQQAYRFNGLSSEVRSGRADFNLTGGVNISF